ncbi:YibE/F family protein [Clostridiaceae bacterium 35-E11]
MKKVMGLSILMILLFCMSVSADPLDVVESYTETAVVLEADALKDTIQQEEMTEQSQYVKIKITSGKYKNEVFEILHHLSGNYVFDIPVEKGDKVVVVIEEQEGGNIEVFVTDYMRQNYVIYLYIFFLLLIIAIGKTKGIKAVITLTLTMIAIVKVLLPAILKGINPIPITIAISIVVTVVTVLIIGGFNHKSIAAIVGTVGGVIVAGVLAYYVGSQVKLTGLSSEEATMLMYIPQEVNFDFKSLLFSGIIMGALGAVMDVGMSIASAMEEIYRVDPMMSRKELFNAGMNVGKDVMGTMTNTLILAYTGSSIPLLILFMAYETSMIKILNLDMIATEVIRSLAGSIGLVMAIPITAVVASTLMKKGEK